jgi:FG-GAP-like repeat
MIEIAGLGIVLAAAGPLWRDVTRSVLPETAEWTNRVTLADVDGDGRTDLLFANGGKYSEPGEPEPDRVFLNRFENGRLRFVEATEQVFGRTGDLARVIQAIDVNADGLVDVFVGTTFQTQSRLFLGEGGGAFREVTATHLPQGPLSVGDLEIGDVDGDGDLDVVLSDWGEGNNMTNAGGRTRLWLNDGSGRFTDGTAERMPATLVRFSWDLELVDVDNDYDLDVVVSCKRCGGGSVFRNDGSGHFVDDFRAVPQYTNNYDFEAMDVNGDGFPDLVTVNDGEIVDGKAFLRREHLFLNDGAGSFVDRTPELWPDSENLGEDDNMVAFLDADSDGDADFLIGSLSGPERLLVNDGSGRFSVRTDVVEGEPTPGTLGIALADLDGDGRLDLVQAQGEHETAVQEKVYLGTGLPPDTAPPVISMVGEAEEGLVVRARVHDRKTPNRPEDWRSVSVEWDDASGGHEAATPMQWYGENFFRARLPRRSSSFRVCAVDRAGNRTCSGPRPGSRP